jgi:molybdopterin-synthase adenylyltransferase
LSASRYSRQIRFAPFGPAGQDRLGQARVVIVGCGALGTFQAGAMARAGVGQLLLIDRDTVELSNLQRQWLYSEADAQNAVPKASAAAAHLRLVNSEIQIEAQVADLHGANIEDLLEGADLVLDATDNFETRFLLNDYCVREGLPWVYGAAVGSYGLAFAVLPGQGPCLRCIYPEAPTGAQPTCETAGVLNSITSLVAAWQVGLATRILMQEEARVPMQLQTFDSWEMKSRSVPIAADPNCPCCVQMLFPHLEGRVRAPISLCGRNAVQIHERHSPIDLAALAVELAPLGATRYNEFALRFSPDAEHEMTIFPDGRAIIKGTTEPAVARSFYARYIGR